MSRRGQTLLKGHTLVGEGQPFTSAGQTWPGRYWGGTGGNGHGKCSCGALSGELPSAGARKRWHAEHKARIAEHKAQMREGLV